MSNNPEGLYLNAGKTMKVGPRLGSGTCGVVHDVLTNSNHARSSIKDEPIHLAVKLVPFVEVATQSNKKKKKTEMQRNADLLYHEYMLYRNVLNPLRGTVIPMVPLSFTGFGDIPGMSFFIY